MVYTCLYSSHIEIGLKHTENIIMVDPDGPIKWTTVAWEQYLVAIPIWEEDDDDDDDDDNDDHQEGNWMKKTLRASHRIDTYAPGMYGCEVWRMERFKTHYTVYHILARWMVRTPKRNSSYLGESCLFRTSFSHSKPFKAIKKKHIFSCGFWPFDPGCHISALDPLRRLRRGEPRRALPGLRGVRRLVGRGGLVEGTGAPVSAGDVVPPRCAARSGLEERVWKRHEFANVKWMWRCLIILSFHCDLLFYPDVCTIYIYEMRSK